jgi:hypothetical protein
LIHLFFLLGSLILLPFALRALWVVRYLVLAAFAVFAAFFIWVLVQSTSSPSQAQINAKYAPLPESTYQVQENPQLKAAREAADKALQSLR